MTEEERRAWIRTLVVLATVAAARSALSQRTATDGGPGVERDVAAAIDTVQSLRSEEERRARPLAEGEMLDPNRAEAIELDRLPGVGPATASAIVAARSEAPFTSAEDLLAVRGIGPATLAKVRPHLRIPRRANAPPGRRAPDATVSATALVDINAAGTVDLERLPGIGPALAARILNDRNESGRYTRVDDLLRVPGIGPVTLERLRPLATIR